LGGCYNDGDIIKEGSRIRIRDKELRRVRKRREERHKQRLRERLAQKKKTR